MQDVTRFITLAFYLNTLLDAGGWLQVDDVHRHIDSGDLFEWLESVDAAGKLALRDYSDQDKTGVVAEFRAMDAAGAENYGLPAPNNGLCVLLAYCLQGSEQDLWEA